MNLYVIVVVFSKSTIEKKHIMGAGRLMIYLNFSAANDTVNMLIAAAPSL